MTQSNVATANTMSIAIGRQVFVRCDSLQVRCEVLDARTVWGRADVLVKPVSGLGEQWVSLERCKLVDGLVAA